MDELYAGIKKSFQNDSGRTYLLEMDPYCWMRYVELIRKNGFPADRITAVFEVKTVSSHKIKGEFTFLDSQNVVVARLTGYEAIMDAALAKAFKARRAA